MIINVLTLFTSMFHDFLSESIPFIAQDKGKLVVNLVDIRDFSESKHRQVDDYPYGGGAGMVLKPEPIANALAAVNAPRPKTEAQRPATIYFTPQGRLLNQSIVREYLKHPEITIICGHYKEIDQRIRDKYVTDEISIGDYVLSGGELPAMVFIDAIARLLDDVISDPASAETDSHENGLLGCPHYTRPAEFEGMKVPEVLLNGNHKEIEKWRIEKAMERTRRIRNEE
jgi:tRNA (guanine37-N1)-methyltransferase